MVSFLRGQGQIREHLGNMPADFLLRYLCDISEQPAFERLQVLRVFPADFFDHIGSPHPDDRIRREHSLEYFGKKPRIIQDCVNDFIGFPN